MGKWLGASLIRLRGGYCLNEDLGQLARRIFVFIRS